MKEIAGYGRLFRACPPERGFRSSGKEEVLRGLELIQKQLLDTLGRFGLKAIEAKGKNSTLISIKRSLRRPLKKWKRTLSSKKCAKDIRSTAVFCGPPW